MNLDALAARIASETGRHVVVTSDSIDAAVEECRAGALVLCPSERAPMVAALAAAARQHGATVIAGPAALLEKHALQVALAVGPGRLVLARDWDAEPETALLSRRGAVLADEAERPRTLAESPLPISDSVRRALVDAAAELDLRRYPPVRSERLEQALAERHGVEPDRVVVSGLGSVELLQRVLRACTDPGDEVLARFPTFDRLPALCAQEGLALRYAERLDQPAPSTRVVYVSTPSGPDGRLTSTDELAAIRRSLPADRLLVVDRAYEGFHGDSTSAPAGGVVELQTLSKLHGLAGLRVGYAIAPAPVVRLLRRFGIPYGVSELVEAAALAALADETHVRRTRAVVAAAQARLIDGLRALGLAVEPSPTHVLVVSGPTDLLQRLQADSELPVEPSPHRDDAVLLTTPDEDGVAPLLGAIADSLDSR